MLLCTLNSISIVTPYTVHSVHTMVYVTMGYCNTFMDSPMSLKNSSTLHIRCINSNNIHGTQQCKLNILRRVYKNCLCCLIGCIEYCNKARIKSIS